MGPYIKYFISRNPHYNRPEHEIRQEIDQRVAGASAVAAAGYDPVLAPSLPEPILRERIEFQVRHDAQCPFILESMPVGSEEDEVIKEAEKRPNFSHWVNHKDRMEIKQHPERFLTQHIR